MDETLSQRHGYVVIHRKRLHVTPQAGEDDAHAEVRYPSVVRLLSYFAHERLPDSDNSLLQHFDHPDMS